MLPRGLGRWLLLPLLVAAFALAGEIAVRFVRLAALERTLVILAAVLTWAFINGRWVFNRYHDLRSTLRVRRLAPDEPFDANDRVLVVAPHPDDEVLATGGQIMQALAAGAEVEVVLLTCGDAFEWNAMVLERVPSPGPKGMLALGERRIEETRQAGAILGLAPEKLTFLGYPDGGLMHLLLNHYAHPYASRHTGANRVPYRSAKSFGAEYTGQNLERDLADVVERFDPTVVLTCSPKDAHRDHRAAGYVTMRVLGARGSRTRIRYSIVHGAYEYPLPKGYWPALPLYPAPRGRRMAWRRIDLTPEQVERKAEAIRAHVSQVSVMRRFLLSFARRNELMSPAPIPLRDEIYPMEHEESDAPPEP